MLRGAAGAGAVGVAAAAGAGAVFATAKPASAATDGAALDSVTQHAGGEPIVAYLRDAASGEFEVFNGTRQVTIRNSKLAAELLNGLK